MYLANPSLENQDDVKSSGTPMLKSVAALFTFALLTACGGGSGEGGNSSSTAIQTGVFVDSAVEGLTYTTPTLQGVTNEQGEFEYRAGEEVAFSLGSVVLGSAQGQAILTPLELLDTQVFSFSNTESDRVINMVDFLMTLDRDQNPDNGIQIDESFRELSYSVDFTELSTGRDYYDFYTLIGLSSDEQNRIDASDAFEHFSQTLEQRDTVTGGLANGLVMHMPFTMDVKDIKGATDTGYREEHISQFALDLSQISENGLSVSSGLNPNWKIDYDPREITISFWAKMHPPVVGEAEEQYLFGLTNAINPVQSYSGLKTRYLFFKDTGFGDDGATMGVYLSYPEPSNSAGIYKIQNKPNILEVGTWHHFAFTYSPECSDRYNKPGMVGLYHDGESNIGFQLGVQSQESCDQNTENYERPTIADNEKFFRFYPFNGAIDDLRIYNRVLTSEEIARLAEQRK